MEKRSLLVIDSPLNEDYYYHFCVNIVDELVPEFGAIEGNDLESFEKFFFSQQDNIEVQFLIVDMVYFGFISGFSSMIKPKDTSESALLNHVLDKLYSPCGKEEKQDLRSRPNADYLLACLNDIQKALSASEDINQLGLVSKCADLKNAILKDADLSYIDKREGVESVLAFSVKKAKETIKEWSDKAEEVLVFGNINYHPEEFSEFGMQSVFDDSPHGRSLKMLQSVGEHIKSQIDQVIYNGSDISNENKQVFLNLWLLLVSIDFKAVLPSSFYEAVKKMLV